MSQQPPRRRAHRRTSSALVVLAAAAVLSSTARADLPPPPDFKYVPFALTVQGLSRAPGYVMFAYPASESNGAPTSELRVVEEGRALELGRRSPDPRLYLIEQAAFASWRAANPPTRGRTDPAAATLVTSAAVIACSAAIEVEYLLPTSSPAQVFEHVVELVEARPDSCVVKDVRKTQGSRTSATTADAGAGSAASRTESNGDDGCALSSTETAGGGALLAALGVLLLRVRRRRAI